MQRHTLITAALILLIPLTAGHTGSHDETVNTTETAEHTESAPAPVGHVAAVDKSTAIASAAAVLLSLSLAVFGIHRYTRNRA